MRWLCPLIVLGLTGGSVASAQNPPASASDSARFVGVWEGPYESDAVPPGTIKLFISKVGGVWKAVMAVRSDEPLFEVEVTELKIAGSEMSFTNEAMGLVCRSTTRVDGGALKGRAECSQNGALQFVTTYVLLKQASAPPE